MSKTDLSGFIDQGVKIKGELEFVNTLRIDGYFSGIIRSDDLLIVGAQGVVEGEIDVGVVSVIGTVKGKVRARVRLEIQKGGQVLADVVTPSLQMVDGGLLQGKCEMETKPSEPGSSSLEWESVK